MNQQSNNSQMVPEARAALSNMKFEIARELGVNLKQGYNGDLSSRENGYVGGYMVNPLQPTEALFSDVPCRAFPSEFRWFSCSCRSGIRPIAGDDRPSPSR